MPWDEFCSYLSGIMPDTPLGNIVQIRSETDKDRLKSFTTEQRRIRSEWMNRRAKKVSEEDAKNAIEGFKNMFKQLAKGGN